MSILIENISKTYNKFSVLNRINVEIPTGSITALLGPSGSGKSTLLRIIAGLEKPTEGRIWLNGKNSTSLSVQKREIGFVFQNYCLFNTMTIYQNIAFGLTLRNNNQLFIYDQTDKFLNLIKLEKISNRFPSQLSGGQKQRVALARALAPKPKILLLDEPFAALDPSIRKQLRMWVRSLHKETLVTTILITHDQEEAFEIADEILILRNGHIEQLGYPKDIYDYPANFFVKKYISKNSKIFF